MDLKYGKGSITIQTPPGFLGSIVPRFGAVMPASSILKESFMKPIGQPRLREVIRKNKPRDVVVVVSDRTRKIANYDTILQFLISELVDAGVQEQNIEFLVALGTHRPHSDKENREQYGALVNDFRFTQHDCQRDFVSLGKTSSGLDVRVNQRVQQADFVIATGEVRSVREFVELAFKETGIDIVWKGKGVSEKGIDRASGDEVVRIDPRYFRPAEVDLLVGDSSKARRELGWQPKVKFDELVRMMVAEDLKQAERETHLKKNGFQVGNYHE